MSTFKNTIYKKIPNDKRYRIDIAEELLKQFLSDNILKVYRPKIVEFLVQVDIHEKVSIEHSPFNSFKNTIGIELKNLISDGYIDKFFLPIIKESLATSNVNELKKLLKNIKSRKIYEEV